MKPTRWSSRVNRVSDFYTALWTLPGRGLSRHVVQLSREREELLQRVERDSRRAPGLICDTCRPSELLDGFDIEDSIRPPQYCAWSSTPACCPPHDR